LYTVQVPARFSNEKLAKLIDVDEGAVENWKLNRQISAKKRVKNCSFGYGQKYPVVEVLLIFEYTNLGYIKVLLKLTKKEAKIRRTMQDIT
jgi:hypothetical protein